MPIEDAEWRAGGPEESARDADLPGPPDPSDEDGSEGPDEFDPRVREDFEGLLYVGALSDTFTWLGHTFEIRTLTVGEHIEIGLLTKPYKDTVAGIKSYQAAVVAACIVLVDDRPLAVPLLREESDIRARFNYVLKAWQSPVIDVVYEKYLELEARQVEVLDQMGKA